MKKVICLLLLSFSSTAVFAKEAFTTSGKPNSVVGKEPIPETDKEGYTANYIEKLIRYRGYSESLQPLRRYNSQSVTLFDNANEAASKRDFKAAADLFMKAYSQDGSMVCAAYNAGLMYERIDDYNSAIAAFKAAHDNALREDNSGALGSYKLFQSAAEHLAKIYLLKNDRSEASCYVHSFGPPMLQGTTNGTTGPKPNKRHRR